MLSTQFLEILNLCKNYNVGISYNEITELCNIESDRIKRVLEIFADCNLENRKAFLEIMLNLEYMEYHKYEAILDIIADIDSSYLGELMQILKRPYITKLPKLYDYVNILYILANNPAKLYSKEFMTSIMSLVPNLEYGDDSEIVEEFLLKTIDADYEDHITNGDMIYFEDASEGFTNDLDKYFYFRNQDKKVNAQRLIRTIKPEHMPKQASRKNNIIKLRFKEED